jgi:hypothetical protein
MWRAIIVSGQGSVIRRAAVKGAVVLSAFFAVVALPDAPARAAAMEDPTAVRAMLSAGAGELALARIEALQPRDPAAPRWAEWEGLRCEALARLNRHDALRARVSALDPERFAGPLATCLVQGARAALAQKDSGDARALAARVIWQVAFSPAHVKDARLIAIDSYLVERRGDDAFRSMLRFQQDYRPLEPAIANHFAESLLALGLDTEALNWVAEDRVTPARLILQARTGTASPDSVVSQARMALSRTPHPGYWRAIHEAALKSGNRSLQVEALERLLQDSDFRDEAARAEAALRLVQTYLTTASEAGNRERLLVGDDGAWADYAARRLGADPYLSRAVYAYLARQAQNADIRRNAQLQLAYSLYSGGLENTALRVMRELGAPLETLDEQTRYLLGTIASKHNDAALALKLWSGLKTPPNLNAIEWELTLARTALRAGDVPGSVDTLRRLLEGRKTVSAALGQRVLELAQEMLDLRATDAARQMYELLLPPAEPAQAREALFGLGRAYELGGDAVAAAACYLRSALLVQAVAPDALAYQARLLAALNLMRAGLKDDARAQFQWLLKNSKDPALTEAAKRGLSRL